MKFTATIEFDAPDLEAANRAYADLVMPPRFNPPHYSDYLPQAVQPHIGLKNVQRKERRGVAPTRPSRDKSYAPNSGRRKGETRNPQKMGETGSATYPFVHYPVYPNYGSGTTSKSGPY